jgi:serine/threonine protein kinase
MAPEVLARQREGGGEDDTGYYSFPVDWCAQRANPNPNPNPNDAGYYSFPVDWCAQRALSLLAPSNAAEPSHLLAPSNGRRAFTPPVEAPLPMAPSTARLPPPMRLLTLSLSPSLVCRAPRTSSGAPLSLRWALGVTVHVMRTNAVPFDLLTVVDGLRSAEHAAQLVAGRVGPGESDAAADFLQRLLSFDPATRLGTAGGYQEVQAHAFFAPIEWDALSRLELPPPFPSHVSK